MTSIVVDAAPESSATDSSITDTTAGDSITTESVEAAPQEAEVHSEPADSIIPDKFAGKSTEEIIESYQNLEKELGRKAQEVGELRKLSDSFLQAQIQTNTQGQQAQSTPTKTEQKEDFDFFEDPDGAVNRAIENHPRFKEFQQFQAQQSQTAARSRLQEAHPDYGDIVKDNKFQDWVKQSPIRMQMFQAADAYNFDAANELLTTWKDRSMINKTQEVNDANEAERKAALKAGATESRSGASSGGGKVFRRADLINLKMRDPMKYESMQDEIFQAYAEGRVK